MSRQETSQASPSLFFVEDNAQPSPRRRSSIKGTPKTPKGVSPGRRLKRNIGINRKGRSPSPFEDPGAAADLASGETDDSSSDDSSDRQVIALGQSNTKGFITRTAFDAYFYATSRRAYTSDNLLSAAMSPLTPAEFKSLITDSHTSNPWASSMVALQEDHTCLFGHYLVELSQGYNLLFYGYGSKRSLIDDFTRDYCSKRGHIVTVNGFLPSTNVKQMLNAIENLPGFVKLSTTPSAQGLDGQARRIYDFFLPAYVRPNSTTASRPLFIVIHNIDSAEMRNTKMKSVLGLLALNPRIHLIASIDHVNAPHLWSSTEASTRKHLYDRSSTDVPSTRGFSWLYHDLTTFLSYDAELSTKDQTITAPMRVRAAVGPGTVAGEASALHVLAAVTDKAKKLFALLGNKQNASIEADAETRVMGGGALQKYGMQYDLLFAAAREEFIATTDISLKALLGEFRDHGLILSATTATNGSEVLWIPLGKEVLRRIVTGLAAS